MAKHESADKADGRIGRTGQYDGKHREGTALGSSGQTDRRVETTKMDLPPRGEGL